MGRQKYRIATQELPEGKHADTQPKPPRQIERIATKELPEKGGHTSPDWKANVRKEL